MKILALVAGAFVCSFQCRGSERGRILLIRHGEKNGKARLNGDLHLNTRGEIRAAALAQMLFSKTTDNNIKTKTSAFIVPIINVVVAQNATQESPSYRKVETAEFIAKAGNIELEVFNQNDIETLSDHLLNQSTRARTSIVVWDHSTIGHLAAKLLNIPKESIRWPMDRYDVIWEVDMDKRTLIQICQHLLFGDLWCEQNPIQVYPVTEAYRRSMMAESNMLPLMY